MQKLKLTGLAILSGLLMGISWPETGGIAPLFFIALIPLLYMEHIVSQNPEKLKSRHVFFNGYLAFLIFNVFTTWWIWNADPSGMIIAEVLSSLFVSVIFLWFHKIKKNIGEKKGYFALIALWIGFEWVHFNWEFSHPWNILGNTFANSTSLIQWYEYTGVLGGSLWILIVNILLFKVLRNTVISKEPLKNNIKQLYLIASIIIIPILFSVIIYSNFEEKENPIEIVIVQPNIDPYNEKFGGMSEPEQMDRILSLARKKITPNTKYVLAPETAVPRSSDEALIENNYGIIEIRKFLKEFPHIKFIIGITSRIEYGVRDSKPTPTARSFGNPTQYYDAFNTALLIDNSPTIQTYHKSKLVLGVEKLPYPKLLAPLERFAINLGGTFGSLGSEKEAHNLIDGDLKMAPVICYESIYGDYVSTYVKKGAELIFILTNDGWWDDTPGYRQHLAYARLRAIETRRSIARSANTGTSCFINQRGDVMRQTTWWKNDAIVKSINLNQAMTFYSKHGDLLGRLSAAIAAILLLASWGITIKRKFN
ncbi:apolipoprotein N-acyltransferase [Vicingaceae bacterium]|nr:apolipoprotein N-acyltransferase [Vicingaceae bacterium]